MAVIASTSSSIMVANYGGSTLVLDVADPYSPRILVDTLKQLNHKKFDPDDIYFIGSEKKVLLARGFVGTVVLNLDDMSNPMLTGAWFAPSGMGTVTKFVVTKDAQIAYVICRYSGIFVVDLSDPN